MFYLNQADPTNQLYRRLVPFFHAKPAVVINPRPMVSFTFDDFPRSAAVYGRQILEDHGGRGTFYLSAKPEADSAAARDPVGARDLERLVLAGHEVACHTFSHVDCARTARDRLAREIDANQSYVSQILPGYRLRNFAYPYGNVSIAAKHRLGKVFRSCRGIGIRSLARVVDLSLLPAQPLYGAAASTGPWRRLIDANAARTGWLIFFTHEVENCPSTFGTTGRELEKVVAHAARSGSELVTVDQALDNIRPQFARARADGR